MPAEDHPAEMQPGQPIELSSEELEAIAGGIDVTFTALSFSASEMFSEQQIAADAENSMSMTSSFSFSVFQFTGSFRSIGSAMKFINGLSKLFWQ